MLLTKKACAIIIGTASAVSAGGVGYYYLTRKPELKVTERISIYKNMDESKVKQIDTFLKSMKQDENKSFLQGL